jgi:hypothetical protein
MDPFDLKPSFPNLHTPLSTLSAGITKPSPWGAHYGCCLVGDRSWHYLQLLPLQGPCFHSSDAKWLWKTRGWGLEYSTYRMLSVFSIISTAACGVMGIHRLWSLLARGFGHFHASSLTFCFVAVRCCLWTFLSSRPSRQVLKHSEHHPHNNGRNYHWH